MHQEDEPCNTIDINCTVGTIILGSQYNIHGCFFFDIQMAEKHLQSSHWTPFNMTEDVIEQYNNFYTK